MDYCVCVHACTEGCSMYLCPLYLNEDSGAFVHCDHSVVIGPSKHLQGWMVAPLQHSYIKPLKQHTIWYLNDNLSLASMVETQIFKSLL